MAAPGTAAEPTFAELFTPKLATVLREGCGLRRPEADALAGLTVAIVALPLSMAIAIASGLTPDRGLYASIAGGFLVSAPGGSRFQIGGPAGALIVLVAAAVERHGVDGVVFATVLSVLMPAVGFLRLGVSDEAGGAGRKRLGAMDRCGCGRFAPLASARHRAGPPAGTKAPGVPAAGGRRPCPRLSARDRAALHAGTGRAP